MALDDLLEVLQPKITFPTLLISPYWVEQHCIIPDGFRKGEKFGLIEWQAWSYLNFYRVRPDARPAGTFGSDGHEIRPASAFHNRRGQVVLPQKAGKAPYTASHVCVEGVGPAVFAGWAKGGELWDCRHYGCECGWLYEYQPGEAMGIPWPTPLIQITAFSEEQTDNIYDALRPMIDDGPLQQLIPKTGEEFIRLPGKGRIDVVTSSAQSRLGQRVTFVPQDETGIWTKSNGMVKVAETQRRGLAGMGGRAEETTNAWDPSEESVAKRTAESKKKDIFRIHPLAPESLDYGKKAERRRIHKVVYAGCTWNDLDAIEAEASEIMEEDPAQAERFFGNRVVSGSDKAFDLELFKSLALRLTTKGKPLDTSGIAEGRLVTLGFDGSLWWDATGLVATDVLTGKRIVVAWWQRPDDLKDDDEWEVPVVEVNEAVAFAMEYWTVWRLNGDPPHYREEMAKWAGKYPDKVVAWETNNRKKMGVALKAYATDMRNGLMPHGPRDDSPEALAAHAALIVHHGNAVKWTTNIRDDSDPRRPFLWLIGKEAPKSKKKIDLCMAAVLSWEARREAIAAGVLEEKPKHGRYSDVTNPGRPKRVDRSKYLPCKGCKKPIHPSLHKPDAPERGRCLKCRKAVKT